MESTKKQRGTRQRRLVLDAVMNRCDHPNAEQIYDDVSKIDNRVSKGTVYRNLSILSENEDILHVKVPGSDRYDSRLDLHCHIICIKCGKVIDAPIPYRNNVDEEVAAESGFTILRHRTLFEGICPECEKEKIKNTEE